MGDVVADVDWDRWSVVLLKPDCVRRGLVDTVLDRIAQVASVRDRTDVPEVAAWQIHVHYWDLLVGADWFDIDIPAALHEMYVGRSVAVALVHGAPGTPRRVRDLLGHYDPARARRGALRRDLGADSLVAALTEDRLVENLVHSSDDAAATRRDFGTWYGARQHHLLST
ncbi:nucleoside-diphosphate kinase [Streptomyces apocyni]|uniref:nucleoside-diphosphate kinase n=1 Tax=Streptomyces apocyni TaxID=2654677 RepID=UPI001E413B82|nr:nucleoside-diphosphate kinase [Streptomyces apocyni]